MSVSPYVGTEHTPGTWRLLYFDAPNRGEQVRQLFFLSRTPFTDVRLAPYPQGLDPYKRAAMGDDSPLLGTDKVPAVTAPDGMHCVETSDIMRFVGRRVGLAPPVNSAEDILATDVCTLAQEIMNEVFYALMNQMCVRKILGCMAWLVNGPESDYLELPRQKLRESMAAIEATLQISGGPYTLGAALSYADVSVFAILNEVLSLACFDRFTLLIAHPRLSALLDNIGVQMAAWIEFRVRRYQLGHWDTIEFLAATNTPLPWRKQAAPTCTVSVDTDPENLGAAG